MKHRCVPVWLSLVLLSSLLCPSAHAQAPESETLAAYSWEDKAHAPGPGPSVALQIVEPENGISGKLLRISNPGPLPLQTAVLTIEKPPLTSESFALRCQVRYEDVAGTGYLEMWTTFPDGGRYFSRTLDENSGSDMSKLSGTCGWRSLSLPFNSSGASAPPAKLTVNVVLPGRGTVYLTQMQLVQARPTPKGSPTGAPTTGKMDIPSALGKYGFAGVALVVGAMFGLDFLSRRQLHRALVLGCAWALAALGAALFVAGVQAWQGGMPALVWAVRMAAGAFIFGSFALNAQHFRRRYSDGEWRRMAALDT